MVSTADCNDVYLFTFLLRNLLILSFVVTFLYSTKKFILQHLSLVNTIFSNLRVIFSAHSCLVEFDQFDAKHITFLHVIKVVTRQHLKQVITVHPTPANHYLQIEEIYDKKIILGELTRDLRTVINNKTYTTSQRYANGQN